MAKNKGMVAGKGGAKTAAPSKVTYVTKMSLKKDTKPGGQGGALAFEALDVAAGKEFKDIPVSSVYVRKEGLGKVYKSATVTVVLEE